MKRLTFFTILLLLIKLCSAQAASISLHFNDAPVKVILQAIAEHQQLNLAVSDTVNSRLTINLNDVEWQQALDIVLHLAQLHAEITPNAIMVLSHDEFLQRQQFQRAQAEALNQQIPLSFTTIKIAHNDADEIAAMLTQQKGVILSDRASITSDRRLNTLFIYDKPENLSHIRAIVDELDKPQQQVQITAHIVTMTHEGLNELGVKWGYGDNSSPSSSSGINFINANLGVSSPSLLAGFNIATLNGRLLTLELSALEQEHQVDIIASPRLLTANNQMATIKQGTELPYEVASGANGATSIEFKSAVLGLEVTPRILPNDKINLSLFISQNTPGMTIKQSNGGEVLAIDTQEIRTQVTIANHETLVLGGVFQRHSQSGSEKVPLLGDIPILGKLFSHSYHKENKRELIIFITPALIDV